MKRSVKWLWGVLVFFCMVLTTTSDLWAVPAFSRAYKTSCVTCHEAFPKRNATGEAFRMNGFQFEDDASYRKQEPVELGDEAYERLWPNSIWPSTLPSQVPFSLITRFMAEQDMDGSREDSLMFIFPEEIEAVWAGKLGKDISFYGDIIFVQKDFGGQEIDSWAMLKAWLEFQDLVGPERSVNLRIGSVGTQGMGLYTARDSNSYYTHYYLYTSAMMPGIKLDETDLTAFNGNPFSIDAQVGVELNGRGKHWMYSTGIVTGNVKNTTNEDPEDDIFFVGAGNDTGAKDLFLQVAYKIGGLGFDGSGAEVKNPLTARPEFWRDDSFIISLFGYKGTAEIEIEDSLGGTWKGDDEFWRLAIGFQQKYKDLTFGAGYMLGYNDNPYGNLSAESVDSKSWFVEANYVVYPWLIPYGRYEVMNWDLPKGVEGLNPDQDTAQVVAGCKALIRANVSVNVEATYFTEGEELNEGIDNTLFVLLNAAF